MRELCQSTSGEGRLEKLLSVIFGSKTNQNFESLIYLSSLSRVNRGLEGRDYLFLSPLSVNKNKQPKIKTTGIHELPTFF